MQTVTTNTLTDTMYYKNIPVVAYKIDYPSFTTTCSAKAGESINTYYARIAQSTQDYCRKVIFAQAVQDADYIQGTRPFNAYTLDVVFQITYNSECITSLYTDTYTYTGGAHGQTIRTSDTWDFSSGKRLRLTDFYPLTPSSLHQLQGSMESQIAQRLMENPGTYFDDYKTLLHNTFRINNFYVEPGKLVIYFQQSQSPSQCKIQTAKNGPSRFSRRNGPFYILLFYC